MSQNAIAVQEMSEKCFDALFHCDLYQGDWYIIESQNSAWPDKTILYALHFIHLTH